MPVAFDSLTASRRRPHSQVCFGTLVIGQHRLSFPFDDSPSAGGYVPLRGGTSLCEGVRPSTRGYVPLRGGTSIYEGVRPSTRGYVP
ncbi:MAG: hypothetical protein V3S14_17630, partial [Anaerolineae bacterium]